MTKTWEQRIAESNSRMPQDLAMQDEINALKAEIEEKESLYEMAVKADNGGQP